MKKFLILASLFAVIAVTMPAGKVAAQMTAPKLLTTTAFSLTLDTVDNTEVHVTAPADGKVTVWKTGLSAQVVVTKISGTVGGTLSFQGSMDGTNWSTLGSASTPSDASANYAFNTTQRWFYYRISWAGTGTMSASFKSYLFSY